jgi:hypothetical protein
MEAEAREVADYLRGLAYHEAAHAMVAWAFKLRVFNYSIKPIMVSYRPYKAKPVHHKYISTSQGDKPTIQNARGLSPSQLIQSA